MIAKYFTCNFFIGLRRLGNPCRNLGYPRRANSPTQEPPTSPFWQLTRTMVWVLPGRKLRPWSEFPFLYRKTVLLKSGGSNSPWWTFRIFFIFFFCSWEGKEAVRGAGTGRGRFLLKIPGGGGSPSEAAGGRGGREGVCREFRGGGWSSWFCKPWFPNRGSRLPIEQRLYIEVKHEVKKRSKMR